MNPRCLSIVLLLTISPSLSAAAPTRPWSGLGVAAVTDSLAYIGGSSVKLEQVVGDHDWADTTRATASLTLTRFDVLGQDIGTSFTSGDSIIFLFGDTIGGSSQ